MSGVIQACPRCKVDSLGTTELVNAMALCSIVDGEIVYEGTTLYEDQVTQVDESGNELLVCRNCETRLVLVDGVIRVAP